MAAKLDLHLEILRLLENEEVALTTREIIHAIHNNRKTEHLMPGGSNLEASVKKVERILKKLCVTNLDHEKVVKEKNEDGHNTWELVIEGGYRKTDQELYETELATSLALAISDRFLRNYMPTRYYNSYVKDVRPDSERTTIEKKKLQLIQGIHIAQRGQQLFAKKKFPQKELDAIYEALIDNRQLSISYRDEKGERTLQPVGVVFRNPRIYLVARDDSDGHGKIKQFSLEKIRTIRKLIEPVSNNLISLEKYLKEAGMDFRIERFPEREDIELVILNNQSAMVKGLIDDIQSFPLSEKQKVAPMENGNLLVTLPQQLVTHQLVEWILGRKNAVKVRAPLSLQNYLRNELKAMLKNYSLAEPVKKEGQKKLGINPKP